MPSSASLAVGALPVKNFSSISSTKRFLLVLVFSDECVFSDDYFFVRMSFCSDEFISCSDGYFFG